MDSLPRAHNNSSFVRVHICCVGFYTLTCFLCSYIKDDLHTPLHEGAANGWPEVVAMLLEHQKIEVNPHDKVQL